VNLACFEGSGGWIGVSEDGRPRTRPKRRRMSASDLKFVIFRHLKDGYRWRLSSPTG
jgi:hypothetical protein